ncbi:Na+/H+ antiporter subunit E [Palleronia caenipelagi]|uniref:Na+/H+ antiporter subunit E n=1 Tax=Palleronia caenipelagi TaxID=2489174 RepID=A0A547Q8B9_9RHOB|nr:Na+/H+ antiporter subunit E [Palleronia caenipelagi]TRD22625.1 Na+/H+ antiporter subunit E [Palleronia caenipelagi]
MARLLEKLIPHPFLSVLLIIVWCLLTNAVHLANVLLAVFLGIVIPLITAPYWRDRPRPLNVIKLVGYIFIAIWDIMVSNLVVTWLILTRPSDKLRSHWLVIPLDIKRPETIAILAGTITLTPGTVSADLSDDGSYLLVHAIDSADPRADAQEIKDRYERRLKEIFE